MDDASQPPPSSTLFAAAAGAFGGSILGVLAATMLIGDGDGNGPGGQAAIDTTDSQVAELAAVAAEG